MNNKKVKGWENYHEGFPWFKGESRYPLPAYSEFMPALKTGMNPVTGEIYPWVFDPEDPYGWTIPEIEEEYQLRPGLEKAGRQVPEHIIQLGKGSLPVHLAGHNRRNLTDNLFWPPELALHPDHLKQERYVCFQPLALSKTKDDKGRVCWTLFGASEQGPEKAFWKSFYESPETEAGESRFLKLMQWVFDQAYGTVVKNMEHLKSLGFRILVSGNSFPFPHWEMKNYPSWIQSLMIHDGETFEKVTYLLTFRPYGMLPGPVRSRYISGHIHLLPFPGSLMPWGIPDYLDLQKELYNAIQMPLLRLVRRDEGHGGIRVPQSGWVHQPKVPGEKARILDEFIVNHYVRTHRWDRFHRIEDGLLKSTRTDHVIQALFSTTLEAIELYHKPMARNCQLLSESSELLLDGPHALKKNIEEVAAKVLEGGLYRYRFYFPPMEAGRYEIFWHRPLVSCLSVHSGKAEINTDAIYGYFTAYPVSHPDLSNPIELWPRLLRRELYLAALHNFNPVHDHYLHQASLNVLTLLDTWELLGKKPLERKFARDLIRIPKIETLEKWLESIPERSMDAAKGKTLSMGIDKILKFKIPNKFKIQNLKPETRLYLSLKYSWTTSSISL